MIMAFVGVLYIFELQDGCGQQYLNNCRVPQLPWWILVLLSLLPAPSSIKTVKIDIVDIQSSCLYKCVLLQKGVVEM